MQNECFPQVKYKLNVKHLSKPWITPSILKSIKKKNRLYSCLLKTKLEAHKTEYKIYKNKLTKIIRVAEKEYYGRKLLEMKDSVSKTWKLLNQMTGRNTVKNNRCISEIEFNGAL